MENSAKKHILFIQPSLEGVGGIEKTIPAVAENLQADYRVSALVFYGSCPESQSYWQDRISLHESGSENLWAKFNKITKRMQSLNVSIKSLNPDMIVVSAHGATILVLLLRLFRLIKVPVFVYGHESMSDSGLLTGWLLKGLKGQAAGFICVSKGLQTEFVSKFNVAREKTVVAYNSISSSQSSPNSVEGLGDYERPYLVTASRIESIKGVDVLVDFMAEYFSNHKGTLFIYGTGGLETGLKEKVSQLGLENRIIFKGYKDNVEAYMAQGDIYVSCARKEAFGLSIVESLSQGVPVLVTDAKYGPREILGVSDSVIDYPYKTPYGILYGEPLTADVSGVEQKRFEQALSEIINTSYDVDELKERAIFFTATEQAENIKSLLNRIV